MKVYFVEYNLYEDRDFYSGWLSKESAEKALESLLEKRREELNGRSFWDEYCYYIQEYEVNEA